MLDYCGNALVVKCHWQYVRFKVQPWMSLNKDSISEFASDNFVHLFICYGNLLYQKCLFQTWHLEKWLQPWIFYCLGLYLFLLEILKQIVLSYIKLEMKKWTVPCGVSSSHNIRSFFNIHFFFSCLVPINWKKIKEKKN